MKITKKYLYKYLKLYSSRYKLKDCYFYSFNDFSHLSTSRGFYPEYYITCICDPFSDIHEVHVYRNDYDPLSDSCTQSLVDKFGPLSDEFYNAQYGWMDLL